MDESGFEEVRPNLIALAYVKSGRFFVDLASTLPFELIVSAFKD